MSSNIDLKAIWLQQDPVAKPDVREVIQKGMKLKQKARNKLLIVNGLLLATTVYYIWLLVYGFHTAMLTTIIGTILLIAGFVAYMVVSNGLLLSLFKSHPETDSFAYLTELLAIRRKQNFIQARLMKAYTLTLSVGMALVLIESVKKIDIMWGSAIYIVLFGWIAFVYFYLKPRIIKKQRAEWGAVIKKLQIINDQLLLLKDME